MAADYHRHDISDAVWAKLEPHLLGQRGQWGGIAKDNRRFINAVLWILRTGAPWRDLPPDYGKWGAGTVADCTKAEDLLQGLTADALFTDRGYDTDAIVEYAESKHMQVIIPPKKNRIIQR